jgi:FkbH-like protein
MKIAVLSNTTMQPIAAHLPGHDLIFSGVGDLPIWLADPQSPASDPTSDVLLVYVDGEQLLPPLGRADAADATLNQLESFVEAHPMIQIVLTTLLTDPRSASSYSDASDEMGRLATRSRWDLRVSEMARDHPNVSVLDLNLLLEEAGRLALVSDNYWYLGRVRLSKRGFELLGRELINLFEGMLSHSHKVLVLDLDNTLWGGVIGEDGLAGIALGEDGSGKCYRDFQRHLRSLSESGVLLAVVSKNDPEIVDQALREHPLMVLRRNDFVRVIADWNNKADHLRELSDDLSLGLESFVFLDDSAVERSLIRTVLPQVAVPDFPERPEVLSTWFLTEVVPSLFPRVRVLDEDRGKTQQYQARHERRLLEQTSLEDFLSSLDIRVSFRVDDERLIPRLSQLTQKTNQFNLTTERASPGDISAWISDPDTAVVACDYADRFGEEGTVGLAVVDLAGAQIRNLLLSCRVLGRGVEDLLLEKAVRMIFERGHDVFSVRFIATPRNTPAMDFLSRHGFHIADPESNVWSISEESS